MHLRFGMHLTTPFDPYVMNPHQRVDLFARSSSALKLVKTRGKEPARSAGLDSNLFPGYGAGVGVEEIDGPDPLENRYYHNLMMTAGMKLFFGAWRYTISEQTLQTDLPLFNMLNVRYFLAPAGAKLKALPSLIDIASLDLEVFESKGVVKSIFYG